MVCTTCGMNCGDTCYKPINTTNDPEILHAKINRLMIDNGILRDALRDLLNDCINFDDGNLSAVIMKKVTKTLNNKRGCS